MDVSSSIHRRTTERYDYKNQITNHNININIRMEEGPQVQTYTARQTTNTPQKTNFKYNSRIWISYLPCFLVVLSLGGKLYPFFSMLLRIYQHFYSDCKKNTWKYSNWNYGDVHLGFEWKQRRVMT